MIVRALDGAHDWTFGKGINDYLKNIKAIEQNLNTRLNSFLGNCFFDQGAGIDWFNLLGTKQQAVLNLAISSVILNTEGVTALLQISSTIDVSRVLTVIYQVQTTYSVLSSSIQVNEVISA